MSVDGSLGDCNQGRMFEDAAHGLTSDFSGLFIYLFDLYLTR